MSVTNFDYQSTSELCNSNGFQLGQQKSASVLKMIKNDLFAILLHDSRAVVCLKAWPWKGPDSKPTTDPVFGTFRRASYSYPIPVNVSLMELNIADGVFSGVLYIDYNFKIKPNFTAYKKVNNL